jgi:hypothetical protein
MRCHQGREGGSDGPAGKAARIGLANTSAAALSTQRPASVCLPMCSRSSAAYVSLVAEVREPGRRLTYSLALSVMAST